MATKKPARRRLRRSPRRRSSKTTRFVFDSTLPWEGGDCCGDEEEAGRQEGCPEEKEVSSQSSDYAGGGTPQRDSYSISYYIGSSSVEKNFIFV